MRILLALAFLALTQTGYAQSMNAPYDKEWSEIDSLEKQGLPRSALEKVNTLYERARSGGEYDHQVRSALYRAKYRQQLEEDGAAAAIYSLQEELEQAEQPQRAVLESVLAEAYFNFLQGRYWQIQQQTAGGDESDEDVLTWSAQRLLEESNRLYLSSVEEPGLKDQQLEDWQTLILEGERTEGLRSTLYELLAFRAIRHFSQEQTYLTEPAYAYRLDDPAAFAPLRTFEAHEFPARDSKAFSLRALKLYQEVLAYQQDQGKTDPLLDADLLRLDFAHTRSVHPQKDSLYRQALQRLTAEYAANPKVSEAHYRLARLRYAGSEEYDPLEKVGDQWAWKEARDMCLRTIERFPESFGANQCRGIVARIEGKSLNLNAEEVALPDAPLLVSLSYRNVPRAYLRLARLSEKDVRDFEGLDYDKRQDWLAALPAGWENSYVLPDPGDFRAHRTEVALPEQSVGRYALLISDNKDFSSDGGALGWALVTVSNISYLSRQSPGTDPTFVVVHRRSGEPMAGVTLEVYKREYPNKRRNKVAEVVTDQKGIATPQLREDQPYIFLLRKGKDVLDFGDGFYYRQRRTYDRASRQTVFFTDRAIYRPGQTVYFKALVLNKDKNGVPSIAEGETLTVSLHDANRQEVGQLSLRTNAYGTAEGTFQTPAAGILGRMYLQSSVGNSTHYFRVEEYKRPRFGVEMDPLEGEYRLNDTVPVQGKAMGFAGNPIDGAEVRYRVTRELRYPWWPWWRGFPPRGSTDQLVASGTTQTGVDGAFAFDFPALPDPAAESRFGPAFYFKIEAEVVDITGETHTGRQNLYLSEKSLLLGLSGKAEADRQTDYLLYPQANNLSGQPLEAEGSLTVHRLASPGRFLVSRYWERPDQPLLEEKVFTKLFPHLPYADERDPLRWEEQKQVYDQPLRWKGRDTLQLDLSGFDPGYYRIKLQARDASGETVEAVHTLMVYDSKARRWPAEAGLQIQWLPEGPYEPGQEVRARLAASDGAQPVFMEVRQGEAERQAPQWLKADPTADWTHEFTRADRGNLSARFRWVRYNRAFGEDRSLQVPWKDKELEITFETFRDKLRPGQEEEWRLRISGPEGDRVQAELVASLYDASLDEFTPHNWPSGFYPTFSSYGWNWQALHFGKVNAYMQSQDWSPQRPEQMQRRYPRLNTYGLGSDRYAGRGVYYADPEVYSLEEAAVLKRSDVAAAAPAPEADGMMEEEAVPRSAQPPPPPPAPEKAVATGQAPVTPRRNLKETAFFFPRLTTDANGDVLIRFTMGESLTRWRFLAFAHSKALQYALAERELVTQKELMVLPNAPRFLREGDRVRFNAKVSNLSEKNLNGTARLELFDARSMQPLDWAGGEMEQAFDIDPGRSAEVAWPLAIPEGAAGAIVYRVTARAGQFADGEENSLPVLTNRTLVTETMPISLRSKETETFTFAAMEKAAQSETLESKTFALEMTSNPAWLAVKALPYLMEYPHECTEQIVNRYYANALASAAATSNPRLRTVFEQWRSAGDLESPLARNEELKQVLLEETPWLLDAQNEKAQQERIALLFDLNRMAGEQTEALAKLRERQAPDGGYPWFPGGRSSWYITQYVLESLGHLSQLGVINPEGDPEQYRLLDQAIAFTDQALLKSYQELEKRVSEEKTGWDDDHLQPIHVHWMYTRSFFPNMPMADAVQQARDYYVGQAQAYWTDRNAYQQGLIGLALHRWKKAETTGRILASLRERAIVKPDLGRYWKPDRGWFWFQHNIEEQALLIELFAETGQERDWLDDMRTWLLKNKQTNRWHTTKATAAAVYALLVTGEEEGPESWLAQTELAEVRFPDLPSSAYEPRLETAMRSAEAGTGYYQVAWEPGEIEPGLARVRVRNKNDVPAWGGLYWQYLEDMDKVDLFEDTPLKLEKRLFKEVTGDRGPELKALDEGAVLHPGDKLIVRIELRVDRDMSYVHMKDHRASGLEPVNVLSQYKWQGALGYYESTKDAATHFFFERLPRGTYVFEYPLRAVLEGDFSNGLTTIQCMYAPEFTSHSEGMRLRID